VLIKARFSYNRSEKSSDLMDGSEGSDFMKTRLKLELKSISEMVVSTIAAVVTMALLSKRFFILRDYIEPFH